jgi:cytidylate kinase
MGHAPVRVITVEREYGSRGGEFAHDLAANLGWHLLDAELINRAAKAAGVDPKTAARFDERIDPWYYRYGKLFWHDSSFSSIGMGEEHVFDSEKMLEIIKQQILKAAREGNCVIVGRGAACALAGFPGSFHVFVYATMRAKREWFARAFPNQADQAEQHLAAFDKRRATVIRKAYQQEWCARGLYHLLLNSCIGNQAMIRAVESAASVGAHAESAPPGDCATPGDSASQAN